MRYASSAMQRLLWLDVATELHISDVMACEMGFRACPRMKCEKANLAGLYSC